MTLPNRPLSPHIQIYRWTLTMILSILHRISGIVLYGGTLLLVWWLVAVASGGEAYDYVAFAGGSWLGQLVLFGYTWAFMHHMCGGIRHLIWDIGKGFGFRDVERIALLSAIVPFFLTLAVWGIILSERGA